jgi:hypothetical protein
VKKLFGRFLRIFGLGPILHKLRENSWRWRSDSLWVPPGHYYSPLFTRENLESEARQLSREIPRHLANIDLDEGHLLENLARMNLREKPVGFPRNPDPSWRYHSDNHSYPDNDAACLAGMARIYRPKRIIEVGCGFSSSLLHDLNDREWDGEVELSFVDPDPVRMLELLRDSDKAKLRLQASRLQDTDPAFFRSLQSGDFLVIDSTHVAKTGSDVLFLFFEVFPILASGVLVHIHDISWPFEYPNQWLKEGRSWNEAYILRAFLMHNDAWSIEMCNSWLMHFLPDPLREAMPGITFEGASFWLCKK